MTTLLNGFEGGTSGTTISAANSGGASGNPFDTVTIQATCTAAYDATHAAHGSLSAKFATGATTGTSLAEWTTSEGTQTTIYYRLYAYFTAGASPDARIFAARSGASHAASFLVHGTTLEISYTAGFTSQNFATPLPVNTWFRIAGYVIGDPSAGAISASLYLPMDSPTPLETKTVTGVNTVGALTQYWFGQSNNSASSGPFWLDDVGISSTGPLGPSGAASRRSTSIVPSLIAAGAI